MSLLNLSIVGLRLPTQHTIKNLYPAIATSVNSNLNEGKQQHTNKRLFTQLASQSVQGNAIADSSTRLSINGRTNNYITHVIKRYESQILRPYVDPKLSYAFGRSTLHLLNKNVHQLLSEKVKEFPNEIAIISHSENIRVTYSEFEKHVNRVAKSLLSKFGIQKGDVVGIFAFNCYNWIVIQYACCKIGAVLAPINPLYKSEELAYLLQSSKVKLVFMPSENSDQAVMNNHFKILHSENIISASNSGNLQLKDIVFVDDGSIKTKSDLSKVEFHDWTSLDNDGIIHSNEKEARDSGDKNAVWIDPSNISPDDLFAIYYTSGTTGKPKGACVSYFTALNNMRFCINRLKTAQKDKLVSAVPLPLFHIFAGVLLNFGILAENMTTVWTGARYNMKNIVDAIVQNNCNIINLTPTMLIDLLAYVENNKLTLPLTVVQSGGAPLLPEVVERAYKILPNIQRVSNGYGSTENGAVATLQTKYEPLETRALTVGPPLDFTEVRIVEPNTDNILPFYEKGEIETRGYNTMVGYLDNEEKTNEVLTKSRWYRTGDMGVMFPHGSVQISGRHKDLIIKGGENVYPKEVEQVILKLDYVVKVHVFGVPDKRYGEQVCAWIELKTGYSESSKPNSDVKTQVHPEDVIKFCKENITHFKVPKYVIFVKEFPLTQTKKVQNHRMREKTIEMLNLHDQV